MYRGAPVTEGFGSIRQAGECVSVVLILEDGRAAVGDCAAVQYSGAGGRGPLFLAETYLPILERDIRPLLQGRPLDGFRALATFFDTLTVGGRPLHTAARYGLTQALLQAQALADGVLMTEVVAREWDLPIVTEPVPLFGQTGDDRYAGADKMILKGVDVLPHGLINNIPEKLGRDGEKLKEYVAWLARRVTELRASADYRPTLHVDVYGTLGMIFDYRTDAICDYLAGLEDDAQGLRLYIEGPVDVGERGRQIEALHAIRDGLETRSCGIRIVADEWCNTLEDVQAFADAGCCHMAQIKTPDLGGIHNVVDSVLYCRGTGMESYQGGTCNETDVSARICTHLALASRPERLLIKPGMGFDEGCCIVYNEMQRTLALLRRRHGADEKEQPSV